MEKKWIRLKLKRQQRMPPAGTIIALYMLPEFDIYRIGTFQTIGAKIPAETSFETLPSCMLTLALHKSEKMGGNEPSHWI